MSGRANRDYRADPDARPGTAKGFVRELARGIDRGLTESQAMREASDRDPAGRAAYVDALARSADFYFEARELGFSLLGEVVRRNIAEQGCSLEEGIRQAMVTHESLYARFLAARFERDKRREKRAAQRVKARQGA